MDRLRIVVGLTKGDRGAAHIFNVGISVNDQRFDLMSGLEHYVVKKPNARDREIDWNAKDLKYVPFLNPGERAELAMPCDIGRNELRGIQVVVVGRRKWSWGLNQWRSSAVSLQLPPLDHEVR
jgi:hypothetical protein